MEIYSVVLMHTCVPNKACAYIYMHTQTCTTTQWCILTESFFLMYPKHENADTTAK